MSTELAKQQSCILVRGGLELWIATENVPHVESALADTSKRFIRINGQLINPFEILGIFTAEAMEDRQRRKNGQWKCMKSNWHEKGKGCECKEYKETVKAYVEGVGEVTYKR